jgi:hypothetical protein
LKNLLQRGVPDATIVAFTEVPTDAILEAELIIKRDEVYKPKLPAEPAAQESMLAQKIA